MSSKYPLITEFDDDVVDLTKRQSAALAERLIEICALYTLSKQLNETIDIDNLFNKADRILEECLGVDHFSIMLLDDSGETLSIWKASGLVTDTVGNVTFKLGEGICGMVAKTGKPALAPDVSKDTQFLNYKTDQIQIGSFYSTPLLTEQEKVIGVFNVHKPEPRAISVNETPLYNAAARNIALALENSRLLKAAQQMAITDELTTLYSRRYYTEAVEKEISKARRSMAPLSLIFLDLDFFKSVNDTYGHAAGDDVLREVGRLLRDNTRQGDVCARYGGEEFAVLLPGADIGEAVLSAEKLRDAVERKLSIGLVDGFPIKITMSAGVASLSEEVQTADGLMALADNRLLAAKRSGRNRVCHGSSQPDKRKRTIHSEKRSSLRSFARVLASRKPCGIRSMEILADQRWLTFAVEDISKTGLRGVVNFKPENGKRYKCRSILSSHDAKEMVFFVNCVWSKKIGEGRYLIGVHVEGMQRDWNKTVQLTL